MANAIEFNSVSFTYDNEHWTLKDINLTIEKGSFVCILGGNGSGKSTLAKHINALLLPDEGEVHTLGYETRDPRVTYNIRSAAGMVFQNPDDQLVASVVENDIAFGPENLGVPTEELRSRVTDALVEVGLQGFDERETNALSGGQKQRVAIAGILAMNPEILILDEATAMLDPRGRKGLMRVCHELHERGMTIVMITHFMEEAAQAERIIVLDQGHIALDGTPEEVFSQRSILESLHLEMPFAAQLSNLLEKASVDIPIFVETNPLKKALCALHSKA